ncbi:D(2) dopamine receptor-like isoform X2 [Eriocheir sinensis]|uniref:D(2) dopamine receptor-like isoform X2 n=1 Tax=Eriocheir sinensis TaxID=95602 RepID=UPI0021CAADDB|nr:D(2) dopamine receptor-like isoform X2 [Eriocheir sinensis]
MANCTLVWLSFDGEISDRLMLFFVVYCYFICFIGTLFNVAVVWCVVGCPRTRPSVKVLLCGLFSSTLLMCLSVMPFMAHVGLAKMYCDIYISKTLTRVMLTLYIVLTEMEIIYITILALLRAVAVWSTKRRQVTLPAAVTLLVATAVYCVIATMLIVAPFWVERVDKYTLMLVGLIYNSAHVLAPVVVTLACYLSMMVAVRRNKRRLAASQHAATGGGQHEVMDQATRAMLAVFISNLLFCLPHSAYHMLPQDFGVTSYVTVHCVFYTHLFVDPLAYLCSNVHHRRRVLQTLASCTRWAAFRHPTASTLPLNVTPPASDEARK